MLKFQMSVSISELIVVMFFFLVSMSHQFLNNFFGEYIIQKVSKYKIYFSVVFLNDNYNHWCFINLFILLSNGIAITC